MPASIELLHPQVSQAIQKYGIVTKVVLGGGNRSTKLLINPSELNKLPDFHLTAGLGLPREASKPD